MPHGHYEETFMIYDHIIWSYQVTCFETHLLVRYDLQEVVLLTTKTKTIKYMKKKIQIQM